MIRVAFSSLRVRLVLLVLVAVVPALGMILYTGWEQRKQAAAKVQEHALRLARITAGEHKHLIEGAHPGRGLRRPGPNWLNQFVAGAQSPPDSTLNAD